MTLRDGHTGLIGRGHELARIDRLLVDLDGGRGGVVALVGPAGSGKTALLEEIRRRAATAERTVLDVRCQRAPDGLLSPLHAVLDRDLDDHSPAVRRAARALADTTAAPLDRGHDLLELGWPFLDGLVVLFEALTAEAPTLLLVDDLQWADAGTATTLRRLITRLDRSALLTILATRPLAPRDADDLDAGRVVDLATDQLRLDDLPHEQAVALVETRLGRPPGPRLIELVARTGGNPLLILELLRALEVRGQLDERLDGADDFDGWTDAPTLAAIVKQRLDALGTDERELLRLGSLLGTSFAPRHLAVATDRTAIDLHPALEHLLGEGLLAATGTELRFRHDLVRDAVYDTFPLPIRVDLHRELADRFVAAGFPTAVTAPQFLAGGRPGDRGAVAALRGAASEAMSLVPARAAHYLQRALELTDDELVASAILADLAWAMFWTGEVEVAERMLGAQIARLDASALRLDLEGRRAQALFVLGRLSEVVEVFTELADAESHPRASLYRSDAALTHLLDGRPAEAAPLAERALTEGEAAGDLRAQCQSLGVLALVAGLEGRGGEALDRATTAVELAEHDTRRIAHRDMPYLFLMQVLSWFDRSDDAERAQISGLARSRDLGAGWHVPLYLGVFSDERFRVGQWDDAMAEAEAALQASQETGAAIATAWPYAVIAGIARRRGEHEAARAHLDAAFVAMEAGANQGADVVLWEHGLWQVDHGDRDEGVALLDTLWQTMGDRGIEVRRRQFVADYLRIARTGRGDLVPAIADAASRWPSLDGEGFRAVGEFVAAIAASDPTAAEACVERHASLPRPVEHVAMLEELAVLHAELGDTRSARRAGAKAIDDLRALTASGTEAALRGRLDALGVALAPASRADRPTFGWESLTPSEIAVVRLVAKGATNNDIAETLSISPRTVESHLHHVYGKVECTTRVELAIAAAGHPVIDLG